jgi:voltage-gated potassium channel
LVNGVGKVNKMHQVLWRRYGFQNLLIWMFLYLALNPFLSSIPYSGYIFEMFLALVLFFAMFAVAKEKKTLTLTGILLVLTLLFHWLGIFGIIRYSDSVGHLIMVMYLGVLVYSFFRSILHATKVTASLLCATLCLYLIIGLLWASLFAFLESVSPGSFSGNVLEHAGSAADRMQSFIYFSFITLTTLGYGDITPQTQGAGALCQAEAIVGQFYIAVLVARLVSMYGSDMNKEDF